MLSLRNLHLPVPVIMAPMAGVSDLPFRLIARELGCPLAFTEMVNAQALGLTNGKTLRLLESSPLDRPLGVQLLGREPQHLQKALDALEGFPYDLIDLNAACPVRKVTRKGEGAALLKEPDNLSRLVRTLVKHARVPVTVKIRSGWDQTSVNAPEIAKLIADAGADAICVHGRTKSQGYGGKADPEVIRGVKEAVSIPVFASGDIFSVTDALRIKNETGSDGVMVARGGLGNPWIFREIAAVYLSTPTPLRPELPELSAVMEKHLALSVRSHGPERGILNFRKFFVWYTRGLRNARTLRPKAMLVTTFEEMKQLIDGLQTSQSPGLPLPASQESPCGPRSGLIPASSPG